MITFDIKFTVADTEFTANVHRMGGGPVQYHVFNIQPRPTESFPNPLMLIWNYQKKQLEFPLDPNLVSSGFYEALTNSVFLGIKMLGLTPG